MFFLFKTLIKNPLFNYTTHYKKIHDIFYSLSYKVTVASLSESILLDIILLNKDGAPTVNHNPKIK